MFLLSQWDGYFGGLSKTWTKKNADKQREMDTRRGGIIKPYYQLLVQCRQVGNCTRYVYILKVVTTAGAYATGFTTSLR